MASLRSQWSGWTLRLLRLDQFDENQRWDNNWYISIGQRKKVVEGCENLPLPLTSTVRLVVGVLTSHCCILAFMQCHCIKRLNGFTYQLALKIFQTWWAYRSTDIFSGNVTGSLAALLSGLSMGSVWTSIPRVMVVDVPESGRSPRGTPN